MNRKAIFSTVALLSLPVMGMQNIQAQDTAPATPAAPAADASATADAPLEIKDPVAVVNGKSITKAELDQRINELLARQGMTIDQLPPDALLMGYHQILNGVITQSLVEEKAESVMVGDAEINEEIGKIKEQFETPEQFTAELQKGNLTEAQLRENIKKGLKSEKWLDQQIKDVQSATEADAKKFYDENPENFEEPEMVRASHILIMTPEDLTAEQLTEKEKLAKSIETRAKGGEDFAALAKEFSEDPGSKENGGDLDFFAKDRMVPEFAEAAFAAEVNSITSPVKSQFGYHVIKVTDKKEAGKVDFDKVKADLIEGLTMQRKQQAVSEVFTKLRTTSDTKINLPPLPDAPAGQ